MNPASPLRLFTGPRAAGSAARAGVAARLLVIVAVLAVGLGSPGSELTAQIVPEGRSYQAALERYERIVQERGEYFERYERAMEELDAARVQRDEEQLDRAFAHFATRADELMELDRMVADAAQQLERARRAYLEALDREEETVLADLEEAATEARRQVLSNRHLAIRTEAREVASGLDLEDEIALLPMPELTIDPRDGPQEILIKARHLERRAVQYDSVVAEIDRRIEERERRLRRDRSLRDNLADLSRFDDVRVPMGRQPRSPQDVPEGVDVSGSQAGPLEGLTLEEEIALLQSFRARAETLRARALAQAQIFRERIRSTET